MTDGIGEVTTARLRLVPMGAGDIDDVWRMLQRPDVRRFLCDDKLLPRLFVEALVAENTRLAPARLGLRIIRDGQGFCGFAGIKPVSAEIAACIPPFRDDLEASVALEPRCWELGYATEALAALIAAWHALGTGRRIVAVADAPNARSRRMLERLGFVATGVHGGSHYPLVAYEPATAARGGRGNSDRSISGKSA